MLGIIVWAVLIIAIMTLVSPEIWIVFLVAGAGYLVLAWGWYKFREKVIDPWIEDIQRVRKKRRFRAERMRRCRYVTDPGELLERDRNIAMWEAKHGKPFPHSSRINRYNNIQFHNS